MSDALVVGRCLLCGTDKNLDTHHLVPQVFFRTRGAAGKNHPHNRVPLCSYCHRCVDGHLPKRIFAHLPHMRDERMMDARRRLRANLSRDNVEYVASVRGSAWLARWYPLATLVHDDRGRCWESAL